MTRSNFVDSGLEEGFPGEDGESTMERHDSLWKKGRDGKYRPVMLKKKEIPYLLVILCLLVALVAGGFFLLSGAGSDDGRMDVLEKRLAQIESRLGALEAGNGSSPKEGQQDDAIRKLGDRFNRLESSLAKRIGSLDKAVARLKTGPPPAPVKKVVKKPAKKVAPPEKKPAAKYHVVSKKETLYRISRTYGLSVEQLLKLNGLPKNAVIQPGQKLKVSP